MPDDLSALLAIRPMPSALDGDPSALSWLDRVSRDPAMFNSARRVAAWLAEHGAAKQFARLRLRLIRA